jgi:hypothetical protein
VTPVELRCSALGMGIILEIGEIGRISNMMG